MSGFIRTTNQRPNQTKTIPLSEYNHLVQKSKAGWRAFYILRDDFDDMGMFVNQLQGRCNQMRQQIERGEDVDITFLKSQFVEMYDKLKEYTDCVVCLETINKDNIEVPRCGHIICKECFNRIKSQPDPKCPTCRKKY